MDLYLINGHDGFSLPEMIDWDIKLSNPEISEEVGVNSLMGLGYELPSIDIEDEPSAMWAHTYPSNSNSSFELDFLGEGGSSVFVNPSSIMPFVSTKRGMFTGCKEPDDDDKKKQTKCVQIKQLERTELDFSDSKSEMVDDDFLEDDKSSTNPLLHEDIKIEAQDVVEPVREAKIEPFEFVNVTADNKVFEVPPQKKVGPQKRQVVSDMENPKFYPKPAYSYSCLIAMALKNSHKGSLPVSEIYSFMCHHFPYFKTAPSGWKNSVRHNLSLNKCFEKIEKPPGIGVNGSQRKGCLWAMNPAKISKMDDEVAKWSRKDPYAIKKAMICPDNLELLERGELKDDAAYAETDLEEDTDEAKEEDTGDELGGDAEDERISPIDDDSEDEMSRVPPSLLPFEPKFHNGLTNNRQITEDYNDSNLNVNDKMNEHSYTLGDTGEKHVLGLDESTAIYCVDPRNENMLIELPIVKRARVQGNYLYKPVINLTSQHRSVRIESP